MTSHSGFTVVEEHNLRKGEATYAEIEQCILDITTWFAKNSTLGEKGSVKPSKEDIQSLSKTLDAEVPEVSEMTAKKSVVVSCGALQVLLLEVNGAIWFNEKKGLSLQEISKIVDNGSLPSGVIPFARDVDDNMLIIDSKGAVREWSEDDGIGEVVSKTLSCYLEKLRDDLLSGHYEFVEELGVVEKASSGK